MIQSYKALPRSLVNRSARYIDMTGAVTNPEARLKIDINMRLVDTKMSLTFHWSLNNENSFGNWRRRFHWESSV